MQCYHVTPYPKTHQRPGVTVAVQPHMQLHSSEQQQQHSCCCECIPTLLLQALKNITEISCCSGVPAEHTETSATLSDHMHLFAAVEAMLRFLCAWVSVTVAKHAN